MIGQPGSDKIRIVSPLVHADGDVVVFDLDGGREI